MFYKRYTTLYYPIYSSYYIICEKKKNQEKRLKRNKTIHW